MFEEFVFKLERVIELIKTFRGMDIPLDSPEPQISHFTNFTPCEELVPKRHFWKM